MKLNKNYCTCWFRGTWNQWCKNHDKCYGDGETPRADCDAEFGWGVATSSILGFVLAPFMFGAVRLFGGKHYRRRKMIAKIKKLRRRMRDE